jgi:hypothetical protein
MKLISESTVPNGHDRAADRAAINKTNAQKSTGPRTEGGKQRSRLNAFRHGLTGHTIVLPAEDQAVYQRHSQSFLDDCGPKGAIETQLVQSLIDSSWQLNRAAAIETNLLSLGITENEDIHANHPEAETALTMARAFRDNNRAIAQISIYRQRLTREFERTLALLRRIQAERREREERELNNAAKLLKMHNDENRTGQPAPYNPADDGFVFSNAEIEAFIGREERWQQATDHELNSDASYA